MKEGCRGGGEGTPGGHISFHLFQKVFLITFLLPLLLRCFNLEQDTHCTQIKPDRVFPPHRQLWDAPQLSPVPPLCVSFGLRVLVSRGRVMNDRWLAVGPALGLPQAICAKLLCLIADRGGSKGGAVKVDLPGGGGHCEKPQTLRRGVHVSSSLSQSILAPPAPLGLAVSTVFTVK